MWSQQWVDLNGSPGVGGIYQDITISTAGLYRLSFAMNGNYGIDNDNPRTMDVSLGTLFTGSYSYTYTYGQPWVLHSVTINVSTAGTYRLAFISNTDTNITRGPF